MNDRGERGQRGQRDARVDAYIANAAAFAQPILIHIREQMHHHCPEVAETIKWGMPHFDYKGIFAGMAAFKAHCALGFWKGKLLAIDANADAAMGQFGRITAIEDLPGERDMARLIKAAMVLNDDGIKSPMRANTKAAKPPVAVPADVDTALRKNQVARGTFDAFSDSNKREYLEWITEAKTEATRDKRLAQAIAWMAEGKVRNWKYLRK